MAHRVEHHTRLTRNLLGRLATRMDNHRSHLNHSLVNPQFQLSKAKQHLVKPLHHRRANYSNLRHNLVNLPVRHMGNPINRWEIKPLDNKMVSRHTSPKASNHHDL